MRSVFLRKTYDADVFLGATQDQVEMLCADLGFVSEGEAIQVLLGDAAGLASEARASVAQAADECSAPHEDCCCSRVSRG